MVRNRNGLAALLGGIALTAMFLGIAIAQAPIRTGNSPVGKKPRQEPCWQVAGVSQSAIQERRSIQQQVRGEVQSVCANSSLSTQQRQQQIKQIHQRERQQMEGLISPSQQEAMKSCQAERHGTGHAVGHGGGHGGGPCGQISARMKGHAMEMEEDEIPPETTKPN